MPCGHSEVELSFLAGRRAELARLEAGRAELARLEAERRAELARLEAERRAELARLEAERRAELVVRANVFSEQLSKAAGLWQQAREEHGADFPAWSHGEAASDIARMKDNDALEAIVNDLAERVAKAQREYAQQSALFKMRTSLQAASQVQAAASRAAARAVEEEEAQRERDLRRRAEEASRMLETLTAEVSPRDRAAIEQRAREAVESPQASRRRALLTQLRLDIQRANAAGRERQRMVEQVGQWRVRLSGLEGPEVEELDRELQQVAAGQASLPADMAQKVEGVVARATEAADRDHALGVLREELENLGYVAEAGFETASAQAPEMLLHKSDMEDDYHVLLWTESGALHNRVVREASAPGDRSADRERTDEQMERIWWQDLATTLAAAERRGVRGRVLERITPGAVPVRTIAPLKNESKAEKKRKRRRTGQLKSRAGR